MQVLVLSEEEEEEESDAMCVSPPASPCPDVMMKAKQKFLALLC
jgi:hypothetical protein